MDNKGLAFTGGQEGWGCWESVRVTNKYVQLSSIQQREGAVGVFLPSVFDKKQGQVRPETEREIEQEGTVFVFIIHNPFKKQRERE